MATRGMPAAIGTLKQIPVPQLLIYALDKRLTGTFELSTPQGETAAIRVVRGAPVKAQTRQGVAYLGNVVLELGYASASVLSETRAAAVAASVLHGQALVQAGAITHDQRDQALRVQLVRKIEHLLDIPPESAFAYYDGVDLLADLGGADSGAGVAADPLPLLWHLVRRAPPLEHIERVIERVRPIAFQLVPEAPLDAIDLTLNERDAAEALREHALSLGDLMALGLLDPKSARTLFYFLVVTKCADVPRAGQAADAFGDVGDPSSTAGGSYSSGPPLQPNVPAHAVAAAAAAFRTLSSPILGAVHPSSMPPRVAVSSSIPGSISGSGPSSMPSPMPLSTRTPSAPFAAPKVTYSESPPARVASSGSRGQEPEALEDEIRRRVAATAHETYYDTLGLHADASAEAVQAAYVALARRFHPDGLPRALEARYDDAVRLIGQVNDAYQTLADPRSRLEYDRRLEARRRGSSAPDSVHVTDDGPTIFRKAEVCVSRGDLAQAEKLCRAALEVGGAYAESGAMLAWIETTKPENQNVAALDHRLVVIQDILREHETSDRAHYFLGLLHKKSGNLRNAARDFRRAVELNERNLDALREVRLLELRKESSRGLAIGRAGTEEKAPDSKSRLLDKLFRR